MSTVLVHCPPLVVHVVRTRASGDDARSQSRAHRALVAPSTPPAIHVVIFRASSDSRLVPCQCCALSAAQRSHRQTQSIRRWRKTHVAPCPPPAVRGVRFRVPSGDDGGLMSCPRRTQSSARGLHRRLRADVWRHCSEPNELLCLPMEPVVSGKLCAVTFWGEEVSDGSETLRPHHWPHIAFYVQRVRWGIRRDACWAIRNPPCLGRECAEGCQRGPLQGGDANCRAGMRNAGLGMQG